MYIRTKDGRIVDTEKEYEPLQWAEQARDYALTIKQSENLAELCDEFVYVRNKPSLEKPLTSLIRDISIIDKVRKKSNTTVYGCIWTDKGLIYVAKMNEKGELELL